MSEADEHKPEPQTDDPREQTVAEFEEEFETAFSGMELDDVGPPIPRRHLIRRGIILAAITGLVVFGIVTTWQDFSYFSLRGADPVDLGNAIQNCRDPQYMKKFRHNTHVKISHVPLGLLSSDKQIATYELLPDCGGSDPEEVEPEQLRFYFVAKVIPLVVQTYQDVRPSKLPFKRRRYVTPFEADLMEQKVLQFGDLERNFSGQGRLYRWDLAPEWLEGLKQHYTQEAKHPVFDVPDHQKFILVDGVNRLTQTNEEDPGEYWWVLWIFIGGPLLVLIYLAYYSVLVVNTLRDRRLMGQ